MSTKSLYQNTGFYRIYLAGLFAILALPLLNWPIYFSPPNWSKSFTFQVIFLIILFVFTCQLLWRKQPNLFNRVKNITRENLAFWLLLAVFATQLLATIFSLDFKHSFFGSPYRGGGFLTYGLYVLFAAFIFLIIKDKDWQKLWDVSIAIGITVCGFALISWFGLFSNIFIARLDNISSTIGGPNTLALYLLLLVFPTLGFAVTVKSTLKRIFYLSAFALFCFILILTISQGAYLGLMAGMGYFLMLYPTKTMPEPVRKKAFYGKIAILCLIAVILVSALLVKNLPANPINNHYLFRQFTTWKLDQSRLSAWQIAWKAFANRPILGYGPENFSIGFDRYYDPTLPLIEMEPGTPASWWDKAHNFALNLLVETGFLGFISFALLFGWIFWKLRKTNSIIAHGLATAIIAYFTNLIFNFENFSSYILVFLIVGHAMSLTIKEQPAEIAQTKYSGEPRPLGRFFFRHRKPIAGASFLLLILCLYFWNLKPFNANAQLNKALFLADIKECSRSLALMKTELKKHTIIDGYVRIRYMEIIKRCIDRYPGRDIAYAQLAIEALKENVEIMPYYTRNWLSLVAFNNMLAVAETDLEKKATILNQSREWLQRVKLLSPERHEILVEIVNFEIFEQDYESALKISEDCIKKYPDFNACYWYLGLAQVYLSTTPATFQEGKNNMEKAQDMGYYQFAEYSLTQLAFLYIAKNNYQELEWVYERLTEYNPHKSPNPRYFAGLALVYKKNGKLKEATWALKQILIIQADAKARRQGLVEEEETITLLIENILGLKASSSEYHLTLYKLYLEMAEEEKDPVKAEAYQQEAEEELNLSKQ